MAIIKMTSSYINNIYKIYEDSSFLNPTDISLDDMQDIGIEISTSYLANHISTGWIDDVSKSINRLFDIITFGGVFLLVILSFFIILFLL